MTEIRNEKTISYHAPLSVYPDDVPYLEGDRIFVAEGSLKCLFPTRRQELFSIEKKR